MAIKKTVSESGFVTAFEAAGRRKSFSQAGFMALYDHLWEVSERMGEDLELEPEALDGEYTEYDMEELKHRFGSDIGFPEQGEGVDDRDFMDEVVEFLSETCLAVILVDADTVIVAE